jgi:4-hydroxy-tetrahydrodipicolinate synthase
MTAEKINGATRGVYIISPTPFADTGEIDFASIDALMDYYLHSGIDGLTILGVLGEATKLSSEESRTIMARVFKRIEGRLPVVVGASNPGTDNLVRFSNEAMDMGAAGVMIAPIPGLRTDDQIYSYWSVLLERLGADIPVCYQDYPQTTTVVTSVSVFNRLVSAFENLVMLKHEESPGLQKITAVRNAEKSGQRRVSILIGNGGLYLPQELRRGADGAMTGFAFPEMLVDVCRKFHAGDVEAAEDVFDTYLPLLRHEQQLGFGLAIRKEVLRRRGVIKSSAMRHPAPKLTTVDLQELDKLMARLEIKLSR